MLFKQPNAGVVDMSFARLPPVWMFKLEQISLVNFIDLIYSEKIG